MRNPRSPHIEQFGEKAVLIHWEAPVSTAMLYHILHVKKQLREEMVKEVEIYNTYNSLLLKYPKRIRDMEALRKSMQRFLKEDEEDTTFNYHLFTLPVCYHTDWGWDLEEVAKHTQFSVEDIIQRHTAQTYTVFFQGFLPGFLYLGGLPPELAIPRKKEPRLKVPRGAVGLAENQTGVYPQESAGGWQLIGNCPVALFNPQQDPPSPFLPGDKLKFEAVSLQEFEEIKEEVEADHYQIQVQSYQK